MKYVVLTHMMDCSLPQWINVSLGRLFWKLWLLLSAQFSGRKVSLVLDRWDFWSSPAAASGYLPQVVLTGTNWGCHRTTPKGIKSSLKNFPSWADSGHSSSYLDSQRSRSEPHCPTEVDICCQDGCFLEVTFWERAFGCSRACQDGTPRLAPSLITPSRAIWPG